ncbi:MAG: hypothetical protein ACOVNU_04045 [Candidatus Kapaibacteriota bacterium]
MEVSMDGLRKTLISDYNLLVKRLNNSIDEDKNSFINIPPNQIQKQMDGIRSAIVLLACMYDKNDKDFNAMDENTHFETFNEDY